METGIGPLSLNGESGLHVIGNPEGLGNAIALCFEGALSRMDKQSQISFELIDNMFNDESRQIGALHERVLQKLENEENPEIHERWIHLFYKTCHVLIQNNDQRFEDIIEQLARLQITEWKSLCDTVDLAIEKEKQNFEQQFILQEILTLRQFEDDILKIAAGDENVAINALKKMLLDLEQKTMVSGSPQMPISKELSNTIEALKRHGYGSREMESLILRLCHLGAFGD